MHQVFSPRSILLTGATGFLGKRLLRELLKQRHNAIICLVRADSAAQARERGRSLTKDPRVTFLRGDIEAPDLGLSCGTHQALARAIGEIFHSAASISFDQPLEDAHKINVEGTRALLGLAKQAQLLGEFERFHHISTAYVAGYTGERVDANFLPSDAAKHYRNTYERTKARAERMLRNQPDVPVTIYRPSIVAGDSQTGETCAWNVLYMPMRMLYLGQLPMLRKGGRGRIDCVAVDYVVKGLLALAQHQRVLADAMQDSQPRIQAFHLTAGDANFNIDEFVKESSAAVVRGKADANVNCRVVNPIQWSAIRFGARIAKSAPKRLRQTRLWGTRADRGMASFAPYEPYTGVNTVFDNQYESEVLRSKGIEMPAPRDYLRCIANYAVAAKFGAQRRTQPAAQVEQALAS